MQKSNPRPPRQREARMPAQPGNALSLRPRRSSHKPPGASDMEDAARSANGANRNAGARAPAKYAKPTPQLEQAASTIRVDDSKEKRKTRDAFGLARQCLW